MEACVNNNKAKPQQLELASLLFAWTMLTSTEKMQEVVSLIIYIYVLIDLIFYLKAAMKNTVYLKDPITESVCC